MSARTLLSCCKSRTVSSFWVVSLSTGLPPPLTPGVARPCHPTTKTRASLAPGPSLGPTPKPISAVQTPLVGEQGRGHYPGSGADTAAPLSAMKLSLGASLCMGRKLDQSAVPPRWLPRSGYSDRAGPCTAGSIATNTCSSSVQVESWRPSFGGLPTRQVSPRTGLPSGRAVGHRCKARTGFVLAGRAPPRQVEPEPS
jgi:hypothetical protein